MHTGPFLWVRAQLASLPPPKRVVEIGALNINGSVRPLFPGAAYTAVDIVPGPGVDVVCNGAEYTPEIAPDCVVCCEVFEHTPQVADIVLNAFAMLDRGGVFMATCATDPRAPHSAADGGPVRADEYYANVPPELLVDAVRAAGFDRVAVNTRVQGDLYLIAYKPAATAESISPTTGGLMPPFDITEWLKPPVMILPEGYSNCPDCGRLMKTEHLPDPPEYCPAAIQKARAEAESAAAAGAEPAPGAASE